MTDDTAAGPLDGAALRSVDPEKASEAGRMLGSIVTPKKQEASRRNGLRARELGRPGGRPPKPLSEIPCNCGRGDSLEGHPTSCLRGLAIRRRQKAGQL